MSRAVVPAGGWASSERGAPPRFEWGWVSSGAAR